MTTSETPRQPAISPEQLDSIRENCEGLDPADRAALAEVVLGEHHDEFVVDRFSNLAPEVRDVAMRAIMDSLPLNGRIPYPIFAAIARLGVLCSVEVVPLRVGPEGKTQVLLTQRPAGDEWWPNQWHVPGAM